jgi:hypothetical protein
MAKIIVDYKKDLIKIIKELSQDRIKEIYDFANFLKERELGIKATQEILKNKKAVVGIKKGQEEIKQGEYYKWENIKENV